MSEGSPSETSTEVPYPNGVIQSTLSVPLDRAGVVHGTEADAVQKYQVNKKVSITEVIANKQKKKQLFIAIGRPNPNTGKIEYQLKESTEEGAALYSNGKWFPQKQVKLP